MGNALPKRWREWPSGQEFATTQDSAKVTSAGQGVARRRDVSWDAAPWHASKTLIERVQFLNQWTEHDAAPQVEIIPLPSGAQFLNVIESVFSGMARAIIHNSDYRTVEDAQTAIVRYIDERNSAFRENPRRDGRSIWGKERTASEFLDTNNCKDVRYR
jgi:hypothetical protein